MEDSKTTYQECCLYFTSNSLSRFINTMAEDAFKITGLSPSYAHLMILLLEEPGLSQNEICNRMNVKASTMTRFIDKLLYMNYVERRQEGRKVYIYATEQGEKLRVKIDEAMTILFENYCKILGRDFAVKLTADIHQANEILKKKG
ncbi:MarR family winged helix-turn-helix transcriptional regulator [Aquimarina rhabdastrellae]